MSAMALIHSNIFLQYLCEVCAFKDYVLPDHTSGFYISLSKTKKMLDLM